MLFILQFPLSDSMKILLDKKYGRAVDWWAFGVLIYQMLLQQSPFRGEDEDEIYDAILADEPLYPIHMPRDSVSILQKLLMREPELRLGSGPTDAQEIMSHAFFRNINWDDIRDKKVSPPFMPKITNPTDTSNFDSEFTSVTPVLTPVQSGKSIRLNLGDLFMANAVMQSSRKKCKNVSEAFLMQPISIEHTHSYLYRGLLAFGVIWLQSVVTMGRLHCFMNHVVDVGLW